MASIPLLLKFQETRNAHLMKKQFLDLREHFVNGWQDVGEVKRRTCNRIVQGVCNAFYNFSS